MLLARRMCGCGYMLNYCGTVRSGQSATVRTVTALLMLQMRKEHFYMHAGVIHVTTTAIEGFCMCSIFLS